MFYWEENILYVLNCFVNRIFLELHEFYHSFKPRGKQQVFHSHMHNLPILSTWIFLLTFIPKSAKVDSSEKISNCILKNIEKQHHMKMLLDSSDLNGCMLEFHPDSKLGRTFYRILTTKQCCSIAFIWAVVHLFYAFIRRLILFNNTEDERFTSTLCHFIILSTWHGRV